MKVVAVVPCYNEGKFIRRVVLECRKFVDIVVVSDDASTDNTIAEASQAGAIIC